MINLFAVLLIFLAPELQINWLNVKQPTIELKLVGKDELFNECLSKGQEVRYRFEFELCEKRSWVDSCSSEVVQTHFLSWSPISNSYSMVIDRHRDQSLPNGKQFDSREKASQAMRKISNLDILELFNIKSIKKDSYLHARTFSECRGEYSQTFLELSYYLTLGLVRLSGFNTGWYDYELYDK